MSDAQEVGSTSQLPAKTPPRVRAISTTDIWESLRAGYRDFISEPIYGITLGAIYATGGWMLFILLSVFHLPFLVYPLATGFALIAPFVAAGLYEVSRRREQGHELNWTALIRSTRESARKDLGWMALVAGFALIVWMDIAAFLFFGFIGFRPMGLVELLTEIFTTPSGLVFLVIGNLIGAFLALAVFSISVVSVPLLFDSQVDFVTAMITSVKSVRANPQPMLMWCFVIVVILGLGLATALIGLLIALPILGHASWHLYRRTVELDEVMESAEI